MVNKRDLAFLGLIILIVALSVYILFFIRSESYECMASPLTYGVSKYQSTQGEFTCTCSAPFTDSIFVTKDNISLLINYNTLLLPNG